MRIQQLHKVLCGAPCFIVGTGPSLRVFPKLDWFLRKLGAYVIGLNQAYRHVNPNISITVHPELYLEWQKLRTEGNPAPADCKWVIKKKPPMESLELDNPSHYVFNTSTDLKTVKERPEDTLYISEGVQCTAMDLAARMGASAIFLVGCDACSLGGEHHGHDQHVRFLGQEPDDQYALYRKKTAQVRKVLREEFGTPVITLSPFVGVGHANEDYMRLCQELNLPPLPKPKDTSPYTRKKK